MFKDQLTLKYFKGVQFGEAERESFHSLFEVLKQAWIPLLCDYKCT